MDQNPYSAPSEVTGDVSSNEGLKAPRRFSILRVTIALVLICPVLIALLTPSTRRAPQAARRTQCKNNLKQIGLALANYHDKWNSFPPAYTVSADGRRLHSWRTLLLPYLDGNELYKKLDLTKPWDDPVNQEAYKSFHSGFTCPSSKSGRELTHYLAIVSEDSCFPPGQTIGYRDIKDGSSNTLMVVEAPAEMAVPWMSPQDLSAEQLLSINPKMKFNHTGGFHSLIGDGTVRFISYNLPQSTRLALITRSAGDIVGDF